MKNASLIGRLYRYECRRVLCSTVVWAVLMLLLVAGTWGALNTARLHRRQAADISRMATDEAAWYEDIRIRVERYRRPSPTTLPYWQDPTDVAGFSRYFLRRFAAKPHLPLSALAAGQSDLQPFAVPIRLETLFGGDRLYDFESPRALATGLFDLSFVLTFILPLSLGAVVAAVGGQERDQGILLLVAAQPISPRRWWALRLASLAVVLVPGVLLTVGVALAVAGAPVLAWWPETLIALALVAAYTLFWICVAGACLACGQGAVPTVFSVAGLWVVLTVGVPLAGTLAVRSATSPPSPVADVNELRQITDRVQGEADAVVVRRLSARFEADVRSLNLGALDYSTRLIPITEEMEERLAGQERRRQDHLLATGAIARRLQWLSPQLAFQAALADLAGTGVDRHQAFVRAVRTFQLELRAFMYPRVLEQARAPKPRSCSGCPAKLTFTDYHAIPTFSLVDAPSLSRVAATASTAVWLLFLAVGVSLASVGRISRWAIQS